MKLFVEHGIDINIRDNYDRTALGILIQSFRFGNIVAWLCMNGGVVNTKLDTTPTEMTMMFTKSMTTKLYSPHYYDTFPNDKASSDTIILVDNKEMFVQKDVIAAHSPVLAEFLSNECTKTQEKLISIDTDYDTFRGLIEWMYTGRVESNDLALLIRIWNVAEDLSMPNCARYLQVYKIVPLIEEKEMSDPVTLFKKLYVDSEKMVNGRYVRRLCATILLEKIDEVYKLHEYHDMTLEEFSEFVESLYQDITLLEKPNSINERTLQTKEGKTTISVVNSPSKGVLHSIFSYFSHGDHNNSPVVVAETKTENETVESVQVSWRTYIFWSTTGMMKFHKNFLSYGTTSKDTEVLHYEMIKRVEIDAVIKQVILTLKDGIVLYFSSEEIEKIQELLNKHVQL